MFAVYRYEEAFSLALSLANIDVVSWLCTQVDSGILQQVLSNPSVSGPASTCAYGECREPLNLHGSGN